MADTESAKNEIIAADIAFSEMSEKYGSNAAFLGCIEQNGVLLRKHHYPLVGKDVIGRYLARQPDTTFILTWKPLFADVSSSADLGYTYGIYTLKSKTDTSQYLGEGLYLSIWKRQKDGTWKFVLDTGTDGLGKHAGE